VPSATSYMATDGVLSCRYMARTWRSVWYVYRCLLELSCFPISSPSLTGPIAPIFIYVRLYINSRYEPLPIGTHRSRTLFRERNLVLPLPPCVR
jgi:hypothetical protein